MAALLRPATPADASGVLAIYAPVVVGGYASFEETPPTEAEMAARIAATLARFPWLVCEEAGRVLGYAYAGPHHDRAGYRWSVNVSVYVAEGAQRRGVGRALYTALLEGLRAQGIVNVYAGIALPNDASVGVHEALGFRPVAHYPAVGYKLGVWRDVGWWHRLLNPAASEPAEPVPFPALAAEAVEAALRAGAARMNVRA